IKFFEGLSTFIFDLWRDEFRRSWRGRLAYLLMRPGIGRIRTVFDYEKVGGSILLEVTATTARTRVPALIAEALATQRAATPRESAPATEAAPAPEASPAPEPSP